MNKYWSIAYHKTTIVLWFYWVLCVSKPDFTEVFAIYKIFDSNCYKMAYGITEKMPCFYNVLL